MQPIDPQTQHKRQLDQPIIEIDYARYEALLDDSDLSEQQRHELLDVIWGVLVEFVSLGFGVHPLQHCDAVCGEDAASAEKLPILSKNEVHSLSQSLTTTFDDAALLPKDREQEGIR